MWVCPITAPATAVIFVMMNRTMQIQRIHGIFQLFQWDSSTRILAAISLLFTVGTMLSCQQTLNDHHDHTAKNSATTVASTVPTVNAANQAGYVQSEFVFETAPFPSCHAATIVEVQHGLVAAWFGGTRERAPDVGIWVSRQVDGKWSDLVEVATGVQKDGTRLPCWNPVLFEPSKGPLILFYKVGPTPRDWWGMMSISIDGGKTWSQGTRLPDGFIGPVKNKPVELADGTIICPSSTEALGRTPAWIPHFEITKDFGANWTKVGIAPNKPDQIINGIQPSILVHTDGMLQAIGRTKEARVFESFSKDNGQTWTPLHLTDLPNPNSGTDAVTLHDGRHLLVYNHNPLPKGRSPLNVAMSKDGKTWQPVFVLESDPGEYSYPAVIQDSDDKIHIIYTWHRSRIKHVVLDPVKLGR